MIVPAEYRKDAAAKAAIDTVVKEFAPQVKYIRYSIGPDWTGEWTLSFRVVLSDEVLAKPVRQRRSFQHKIWDRIMEVLPDLDLFPHVRFNYESNPNTQHHPDWTPLP